MNKKTTISTKLKKAKKSYETMEDLLKQFPLKNTTRFNLPESEWELGETHVSERRLKPIETAA